MMMMKTMTDDHDDTLNFGTFHINFISNTSKDDRFLNRGFRLFLFKEAEKIWTLQTNLSKVLRKKEPFRFHFLTGADKNLRVRIPIIPRGVRIKNGMSLSPQPHS